MAVDGDALTLAWVGADPESAGSVIDVPRQLIADIAAEPAAWTDARASVAEGDVVDFQREMLVAA